MSIPRAVSTVRRAQLRISGRSSSVWQSFRVAFDVSVCAWPADASDEAHVDVHNQPRTCMASPLGTLYAV